MYKIIKIKVLTGLLGLTFAYNKCDVINSELLTLIQEKLIKLVKKL